MNSSRCPRLLDEISASYMGELADWPVTTEEVDAWLDEAGDDEDSNEEALANRVIASLEQDGLTAAGEDLEQGQLFKQVAPARAALREKSDRCGAAWLAAQVRDAYLRIHDGYSIDRLIADPAKNVEFIRECWRRDLRASQVELNMALLRARKSGQIGRLDSVSPYRVARSDLDQYFLAAEIALRSMQDFYYFERHQDLSIDQVLCDPALSARFDELARAVTPGFEAVDYRWAALTLRKSHQRSVVAPRQSPRFEHVGVLGDFSTRRVDEVQGFYWLHTEGCEIYIGHSENLRAQVERLQDLRRLEWGMVLPQCKRPGRIDVALAPTPDLSASKREPHRSVLVKAEAPRLNVLPPMLRTVA